MTDSALARANEYECFLLLFHRLAYLTPCTVLTLCPMCHLTADRL